MRINFSPKAVMPYLILLVLLSFACTHTPKINPQKDLRKEKPNTEPPEIKLNQPSKLIIQTLHEQGYHISQDTALMIYYDLYDSTLDFQTIQNKYKSYYNRKDPYAFYDLIITHYSMALPEKFSLYQRDSITYPADKKLYENKSTLYNKKIVYESYYKTPMVYYQTFFEDSIVIQHTNFGVFDTLTWKQSGDTLFFGKYRYQIKEDLFKVIKQDKDKRYRRDLIRVQ